MPKTRGQSAEAAAAYYEDIAKNPLYVMRVTWKSDATHRDYAYYLGVSRGVVAQAEDGCYPLIPAAYRSHIEDIRGVNQEYQLFRRLRRETFWDKNDFPDRPHHKDPMGHLLTYFNLSAYEFASRMCIPHGDVHRLTHGARSLSEAATSALLHIGIDQQWLDDFNVALKRTHAPRVRLNT